MHRGRIKEQIVATSEKNNFTLARFVQPAGVTAPVYRAISTLLVTSPVHGPSEDDHRLVAMCFHDEARRVVPLQAETAFMSNYKQTRENKHSLVDAAAAAHFGGRMFIGSASSRLDYYSPPLCDKYQIICTQLSGSYDETPMPVRNIAEDEDGEHRRSPEDPLCSLAPTMSSDCDSDMQRLSSNRSDDSHTQVVAAANAELSLQQQLQIPREEGARCQRL